MFWTVTPPSTARVVFGATKLVPVTVTALARLLPRTGGLIDVIVGGPKTMKVEAALVPPGVLTVTDRAVAEVSEVIVKLAVMCEEFTTLRLETVMPVPETT